MIFVIKKILVDKDLINIIEFSFYVYNDVNDFKYFFLF